MKGLITICFLTLLFPVQAQDRKHALYAVGIDGFKNLPFLFISQEEYGFSNPAIFEVYASFTTKKPRTLLNVGLGYAAINHQAVDRLAQHITGYYAKIGREYRGRIRKGNESVLWGCNLTLTSAKVSSAIDIQGKYFPSYQVKLPNESGLGINIDFCTGINFLLFRRLEARFIARYAFILSNIGHPNATYLPGAGVRFWNRPFTITEGGTIQLFYLTKRVPKRITSD
ncbi:hypothetical protein [Runella sp.]|uniref:hypothetical protein n=1 Tax=Runella sp. TaxID=1960881 RepID=UPI003D0EB140